MGKIGAVPVEKEVVDAVRTRFKEPGKLDRVFRVGNIEHDQPEISAALLHSDDGQVACDLDVEGRAGPGVRTCAISRIAVGSEISTMCTMPRKSPISAILPETYRSVPSGKRSATGSPVRLIWPTNSILRLSGSGSVGNWPWEAVAKRAISNGRKREGVLLARTIAAAIRSSGIKGAPRSSRHRL